jgi:hypothetical protein
MEHVDLVTRNAEDSNRCSTINAAIHVQSIAKGFIKHSGMNRKIIFSICIVDYTLFSCVRTSCIAIMHVTAYKECHKFEAAPKS